MKRYALRIPAILLCIILLLPMVPQKARAASLSWSLPTLDGKTITEKTYASKTQVLIFYRGTMSGSEGVCGNSTSLISGLKDAYWISNPNIQVIAIESSQNDKSTVETFRNTYAPGLSNVVFAYDGWSVMWNYWGQSTVYYPLVVILQGGEVRTMLGGVSGIATLTDEVKKLVDIGNDPNMVPSVVRGEFRQTEARTMLKMINDFRTGSEAWYWNSDDTTKTTFAAGELGKLTYDYTLEKVAMQRAAEIAARYDHQRPDGSMCFDLIIDGVHTWGENIAYGYTSADSVFVGWREDADPYAGQGHRRNILNENFTSVGFGCFSVGGVLFWTQEFGYNNSGAATTAAENGSASRTVDFSLSMDAYPYAPDFTEQPSNVTVQEGKTATFTVNASTSTQAYGADLLYQWYYRKNSTSGWTPVANNGTSNTYSLKTQARHHGYQYICSVQGTYGINFSNIVTLKVKSTPVITTQPKSVTVQEGKTATFSVTATNATSYQWYYRTSETAAWTAVANNGTSATYSLTTKARHNGYQYRVKVANANGSVYSSIVKLTVSQKPVITAQPAAVSVVEGKTATFKVTATGATSYQWYYRTSETAAWTKVANNGTSATYSLTTKARHNGYEYRVKVTNSAGSVYSSTVKLTVKLKPQITEQPTDVTVTAGKTATFRVTATGATKYQWYYRTSSTASWTAVANNGTSATYNLTTKARHNGYEYRCKVTNANGSVYTKIVKLTVE